MRIRSIKPEFFMHDALFDAEKKSGFPLRLAYIGIWCAADREGRFKWEPRRLGAAILPYDGIDFSGVMDALVDGGWLTRYEVDGKVYGEVPSFTSHQIINNREKPSLIPRVHDACSTRAPRVPHADTDASTDAGTDAAQGEGKGREGKGKGAEGASPSPTIEEWVAHCSKKWPDWPVSRIEAAWHSFDGRGWGPRWRGSAATAYAKAVEWGHIIKKQPSLPMLT